MGAGIAANYRGCNRQFFWAVLKPVFPVFAKQLPDRNQRTAFP